MLGSIAGAMQGVDPRLPLRQLRTQESLLDEYTREERTLASAAGAFAALALIVSMIGLFGLMSYAVVRRTREIGIRMAIGARPATVLSGILREVVLVVGIGAAIGVVAALVGARLVEGVVFGVSPRDPVSLGVAVALMFAVAVAAGYGPARRASRVDPVIALRSE